MKNEILLHLGFYSSKFVHRPRLEILFRQCLGSAFDHFVYKHSTYFSQERNRKSSILLNIFFSISWMFIRVCQGQKSRASPYNRQSVYSHIKRTHTHIGAVLSVTISCTFGALLRLTHRAIVQPSKTKLELLKCESTEKYFSLF